MDSAEKIQSLREMAAAEPDDFLTWHMLGGELLKAGEAREAAGAFTRCIGLNPKHTAAHRMLGDAWRKAGDAEQARAAYEQAIEVAEETGDLQVAKEARALLKKVQ